MQTVEGFSGDNTATDHPDRTYFLHLKYDKCKMNPNQVTGIVLAGGRSSRMGEDKSLMMLNGKTMVEYAIDALKPFCNRVIVSSNQLVYDFTGCQVWQDEGENQAPIVGIYSSLKQSNTEFNFILSCDMPLIGNKLIDYLLECSLDFEITVPIHDNMMIEPLCGVYKKSVTGILKQSIDEHQLSLKECINKTIHRFVEIDKQLTFFAPNLFKNINTPTDFEDISLYLSGENLS